MGNYLIQFSIFRQWDLVFLTDVVSGMVCELVNFSSFFGSLSLFICLLLSLVASFINIGILHVHVSD